MRRLVVLVLDVVEAVLYHAGYRLDRASQVVMTWRNRLCGWGS